MSKIDLTYQNWFDGKIELAGSYKLLEAGDRTSNYQVHEINEFPDEQRRLIEAKQKELFESHVANLSREFISDINTRHGNAPSPKDMISIEAKRIAGIFKGNYEEEEDNIYFLYALSLIHI